MDAAIERSGLDSRDGALAMKIGCGVLQNRLLLDYYINVYCTRRMEDNVRELLRLGAYQILFLDRVPDTAAVDTTVELSKKVGCGRASGLVNAVLRKIASQKEALPPLPHGSEAEYLALRYSHSMELVERLIGMLGAAETESLLAINNTVAPTVIQHNPLRGSEREMLDALEREGVAVQAHPWLSGCYTLSGTGSLEKLPSFSAGRYTVQDTAAKLAVLSADVKAGMRVVDICAAPGGKSFAMAMQMGNCGEIRAFDLHPSKLRLIESGAERLGVTCLTVEAGDGKVFRPELEQWADVVFCDVPCSGLGIIGKKPDIRFKKLSELSGLPAVQAAILENASRYVKPSGTLLYSTCTILPEENEGVTDAFLQSHPSFERGSMTLPAPIGAVADGAITLWPQRHHTDGFYICRMVRKEEG